MWNQFVLLVVVAAIALAAPVRADDTDTTFLADLDKAGIKYTDSDQVVVAGKTVCALKDNGSSNDDVVSNLQDQNPGFTPAKAARFATIAANDYCPSGGEPAGGEPAGGVSGGEPGAQSGTGPPSGTTTH
jgi:hypothetical protein